MPPPSVTAAPHEHPSPDAIGRSIADQVLQAVNPVLESILGRIWDLEEREASRRGRATEQTPEPEHCTPDSHAAAPQSSGHVRPPRPNEMGHVSPCPVAPLTSLVRQVSSEVEGCAAAPHLVGLRKDTSGTTAPAVRARPLADAPPPTAADAFPALPTRKGVVAVPVPTTFAGVLTAGGYREGSNVRAFAKAAKAAAPSPPSSQGPKTIRFVILRDGGVSDEWKEWNLWEGDPPVGRTVEECQKSSAARIVLALHTDIERQVADPIRIIDGAWCCKASKGGPPEYTGDFSVTLAGDVPFAAIIPYLTFFTRHLLRAHLVPGEKWVHAQIRGMPTRAVDSTVFPPSTLLLEVQVEPTLSRATLCQPPRWVLGDVRFASLSHASVLIIFLDRDGKLTPMLRRNGIHMFRTHCRVDVTGDVSTFRQCGRCHRLGHSDPQCSRTPFTLICHICGGGHIGKEHDSHCKGPHKIAGRCDCPRKCLLCGKTGHHARSHSCLVRGRFKSSPLETDATPPRPPRPPHPSTTQSATAAGSAANASSVPPPSSVGSS